MNNTARFHLPGLFEFVDFYKVFLPLFYGHRDWFYEWAEIESIYGAPADCLWGGGRVGFGEDSAEDVLALLREFKISGRLTFSNSLLKAEHLGDSKCNELCRKFCAAGTGESSVKNGVIVCSDILVEYLKQNYPELYLVSSTTKVLREFDELKNELNRSEFDFVVPDFRLNKKIELLESLDSCKKSKVEFLCNECCWTGCTARKECYENVSRKSLGLDVADHVCRSPGAQQGYLFSRAMENPAFIGIEDIQNIYLPAGFCNFKIEGRSLGSAVLLEMLLYYLAKPAYHLRIREEIYLDSALNLF